jgi:predicted transposase/invertase (TIGR01784 family)
MPQKLQKPKFAPLTLDSTFKKAFANEQSTELLLFLLNTFLAEKLKSPIKEVININHELFGKTRFNRDAVFDVYCRDATGTRFVVEVQVKGQKHFIKRTFFYLCMIVCSLAVKGKEYDFNIPRLYSISFLEFELDFGDGCTEVIQYLSLRNDKHPEISYDILQMIFVILPRFKKTEMECKTVMDKILFSLKNGHKLKSVPKSFKEKELLQIFKVAEISNFTERELKQYEAAMMNRHDQKAILAYAEEKGEVRGLARGKKEIAKNMLCEGVEPALVARYTKLPLKVVRALN